MRIIVGRRGSGKTWSLIRESARTGYYIVVHSREAAREVALTAEIHGFSIPFPLTYDDVLSREHGGVKGILVDNVEYLINVIARGVDVGAITLSGPIDDIDNISADQLKSEILEDAAGLISRNIEKVRRAIFS